MTNQAGAKNNILLELIITDNCNSNCKYCTLKQGYGVMTKKVIDNIIFFIDKNRHEFDSFLINFFGGEPLLEFSKVKYFIDNARGLNLQYSIGTNGKLLDATIYKYLRDNNVKIVLSIDHKSSDKIERIKRIFKYRKLENIEVNLVLVPGRIGRYKKYFEQIYDIGIRNFSVLPIYVSLQWKHNELKKLEEFVRYIKLQYMALKQSRGRFLINAYSYCSDNCAESEFVIGCSGNIYPDIGSCLWLLNDYKKLDKSKRYIGNINDKNLRASVFLEKDYKDGLKKEIKKAIESSNHKDELAYLDRLLKIINEK